ncbi:hypothetical protein ACIOJD_12715 [Streptomyces sp. NPDC088116]|uniref:hypothetical protein n=1 Tax=Streptomyces sp. NPDC088116 TaxID=3365825 RepID=UPI00380796EF
MHRRRSAAMVLVGVAVTAVSGCVAVQPRPAPGSEPKPGASSGVLRPGAAEPQFGQSPADEALEAAVSARSPRPAPRPSPEVHRTTPDRAPGTVRTSAAPAPKERPGERPAQRWTFRLPTASAAITDVCALGEMYGDWPAGSPQDRICRETYRN